jgi:DNA-binding GntR family transcriptional regulator
MPPRSNSRDAGSTGRPLQKISATSLADRAREMIRDAIFEGKIQPEEKITIERIAADLGVSRTPVREALKALEADGMVSILPNRGAVVRRFDSDEIRDRYSVRAQLEGYAGELACNRDAAGVARKLEDNCAQMKSLVARARSGRLEDVVALVENNILFHGAILEASGSALVARILNGLQMPVAYRLYHWREQGRRDSAFDFHMRIAAAFRDAKPAKVRQLLETHILETRDYLLANQGPTPAPATRATRRPATRKSRG